MATIPAYGYGSGVNNPTLIARTSNTTAATATSSSITAPLNAAAATKTTSETI